MNILQSVIVAGVCVLTLTARPTDTQKQAPFAERNWRYRLAKGDMVDLKFPLTPEFDQTVTVQPDGYVTLRGVGDVRIEGQTLPEFRELVAKRYDTVLRDPQISVSLKEFTKPYILVTGEVKTPGKQDWRGEVTALQAVAAAGGINEDARHSQVLLFRRVSTDWVEVKQLNVKAMLHGHNLNEDIELQPGDMIVVPKSIMAKIRRYIPYSSVGMFASPGQF